MIREFDATIFDLIPMIQEFDISENQLTTFDVNAMQTKRPKLKRAGLQWNPYDWASGVQIIRYSNAVPNVVKNSYSSIDGIRDTEKIVKDCMATIQKKDDMNELDTCIQTKLTKAIENPKLLNGGEKLVEPLKTRK